MNYIIRLGALALGLGATCSIHAAERKTPAIYLQHAALRRESQQYTDKLRKAAPEVDLLLQKLHASYLYELDPSKVYKLNLATGAVTTANVSPTAIGAFTESGDIYSPRGGSSIKAFARTTAFCPFAGQLAEVSGFMASTISRDPGFGIRKGTLVSDTFTETTSQVDFSILKASGGANNPQNRTVMETLHEASCGDDVYFHNRVHTWPPLKLSMVIDDTGSMGSELAGVQAGLTSFIASTGTNSDAAQRGVSYELISFKDEPTLRLANTTDPNAAVAAVQSLYAFGGGDCPEESLGALSLALSRVDEESETGIVLVTDASPRTGSADSVIAAARAAGVKINVLLTGDCVGTAFAAHGNGGSSTSTVAALDTQSSRVVFERIARETGGRYEYFPDRSAKDYGRVIADMFSTAYSGDIQPPKVAVTADPGVLWPANHKLVPVVVNVTAVDDRDPAPKVELDGITSSEPTNASGSGATDQDIVVTKDGKIFLRAERSAMGPGRIYTITYRATDASGNVGRGSVDVVVPHDQR